MLKIFANHSKQDIIYPFTYLFTIDQPFPNVQGETIRIEIDGVELEKLIESKKHPTYTLMGKPVKTTHVVWNGPSCKDALKILKELFEK